MVVVSQDLHHKKKKKKILPRLCLGRCAQTAFLTWTSGIGARVLRASIRISIRLVVHLVPGFRGFSGDLCFAVSVVVLYLLSYSPFFHSGHSFIPFFCFVYISQLI